jgi:hypothetical protein
MISSSHGMSLEICVLRQMVTAAVGFEREVGGKHDTEFLSLTSKYTDERTKIVYTTKSHEKNNGQNIWKKTMDVVELDKISEKTGAIQAAAIILTKT